MTADAGPEPETRLEILDPRACARLLAASEFGRLALVQAARPVIVVLNHAVEGDDVLFRTDGDALISRLTAAGRGVPAAFEVDSAFPLGHAGWSVIATGLLRRETNPGHCAEARTRITSWARGDRDVVLRLEVDDLTGRRVGTD